MDHPRRWTLILLVLTVVAGLMGSRLTIKPNMLELLPQKDPTAQAIRKLNDEEGGTNLLTIAAQGDDPAVLDAFMVDLAQQMSAMPEVEYALYDLDPDLTWRLGLLQLDTDELSTLKARIAGAVALGPAATNPFMASRLLDLGPLTDKLKARPSRAIFPSKEGTARLLVRPRGSAFDPGFTRPFMARVHAMLDAADAAAPGVEVVWVGGAYRHGVEDVENIRKDLGRTALVSLALVLGLIAAAYRDLRAILLIFVPLVVANIWATGFAFLSLGTLNTFTSFFPAILIGLGVDFSIHLYARYREERLITDKLRDAVIRGWDRAGPPSLTAALTSAGGFCALWVAGFRGFRHLGTILAGGVLLCLLAVLLILPMLIQLLDRKPLSAAARAAAERGRDKAPYRRSPWVLGAFALLTIGAATQIPKVTFETDLSELRPAGLSYADLNPVERSIAESSYSPVVLSYADDATLASEFTRLSAAVANQQVPHISGLLSVHTAIPVDQDARLALLRDIAELARDDNVRFLPMAVQENLKRIAQADLRPMTRDDLPDSLRHILGAAPGRYRILLVPTDNMWDLKQNVELFNGIQEWAPNAAPAGEYLALAVLAELVKDDLPRVAAIALLVVLLMTWLDLRSLPRAVGAVLALSAGMSWAAAAMVSWDIRLSLVNFVGVPILMGIGVDVVIHLMHRIHEEGPGGVKRALATTGVASGLSTATTVMSFAALSVAEARGVRGLGLLIVVGLSLVTMTALVAVPLGFMTAWRRRAPAPPDPPEP